VDPGALILGPVQDGWTRYYYASYDTYPRVLSCINNWTIAGRFAYD
jgi:hypothetical protein